MLILNFWVVFFFEFVWSSKYQVHIDSIEEIILGNANSNGLKQVEVCGFKDNCIKIKISFNKQIYIF